MSRAGSPCFLCLAGTLPHDAGNACPSGDSRVDGHLCQRSVQTMWQRAMVTCYRSPILMTGADDGENARPGELSPRAAAALDRLSTVEAELREQLGPRRAHSAIVVTALLSTRLGADRLGDLTYPATPTDVFRDLDADVERALSAFDAQSVFNELYKTGHLHRTVGDVAAVIRSLSDSDQLMLAGELLKRTADPFVGMFTVLAEIAVLASRLTVGATENGEAHDRLYKRELRVFDHRRESRNVTGSRDWTVGHGSQQDSARCRGRRRWACSGRWTGRAWFACRVATGLPQAPSTS